MPRLKTTLAQREASARYYRTRKGKAASRRYQESEYGKKARAEAQARYWASPKGREAAKRARIRARARYQDKLAREGRLVHWHNWMRQIRRNRISIGLPPYPPHLNDPAYKRADRIVETAPAEHTAPAYVARMLAREALFIELGLL